MFFTVQLTSTYIYPNINQFTYNSLLPRINSFKTNFFHLKTKHTIKFVVFKFKHYFSTHLYINLIKHKSLYILLSFSYTQLYKINSFKIKSFRRRTALNPSKLHKSNTYLAVLISPASNFLTLTRNPNNKL